VEDRRLQEEATESSEVWDEASDQSEVDAVDCEDGSLAY